MALLIYGLVFGTGALFGHASYSLLFQDLRRYARVRAKRASIQLEDVFVKVTQERLENLYLLAPLGLGLAGWLVSGLWFIGLLGLGLGLLVPQVVLKQVKKHRHRKFHAQLVDSLLLLSSCMRAGLSLLQAFSVVTEEMPRPASEEFGLILKETRMGISLSEALMHFRQRMLSDDVTLFVTAVMVARETGGNVTSIFSRLVETLRERRKIRERIKTLTFMSRMQGVMMALLPLGFSAVVFKLDPKHLEFFMQDPDGRMLLAGVICVQLFGMFLFVRFSRSPL